VVNQEFAPSPFGIARELGFRQETPELETLAPLVAHLGRRLRAQYSAEPELAWLALEPVRWVEGLEDEDRRALLLLVLAALVSQRDGSTRLPLFEPEGRQYLQEILLSLIEGFTDMPGVEELVTAIERIVDNGTASTLIGGRDEYKPLVFERPHLYVQRMRVLEVAFVERFGALLTRPPLAGRKDRARPWIEEVLAHPTKVRDIPIILNEEQEQAVSMAVESPITIISGGPGTGKTTIVVTILRILRRLGVAVEEIALAAPTGKAANRMAEAIRKGLAGLPPGNPIDADLALKPPVASTLHRLLGYSPRLDRFKHHENNRLSHSVVIVDEGSMVDLFLMERVVRSLDDGAQFILLGDAEQLPSVEAGAVLRDLIPSGGRDGPLGNRARRLRISHRQQQGHGGNSILKVAAAINAGDVGPLFSDEQEGRWLTRPENFDRLGFSGVEFLGSGNRRTLDDLLHCWFGRFILGNETIRTMMHRTYRHGPDGFSDEDRPVLAELFAHFEQSRVLCLTYAQRTGAERVNGLFHAWHCESHDFDGAHAPGEPVMMLKNDYERQVFNGDQGLLLWIEEEHGHRRLAAVFPRGESYGVFLLDALKGLIVHSFAMTIHKSQGSEFDRVLVLLPETDMPLNTRELLYTAVTRARSSVLIHGSRFVFEAGARKKILRFSGIAERLG